MIKIGDTRIFVGDKDGYKLAKDKGMKIVCCHRNGKTGVSHQTLAKWIGKRSCPKDSPYYYVYQTEDIIALNWVDGDNPDYVHNVMINPAIEFIDLNIRENDVYIYCSEGKSRGPSMALIYLLEKRLISGEDVFGEFKKLYSSYSPKDGNYLYIKQRYNL